MSLWLANAKALQQKKIRHYVYKDHYLVNETATELVEWKSHIGKTLTLQNNNGDIRLES